VTTTTRQTPEQLVAGLDVARFFSYFVPGLKLNGQLNAKCECPFCHGADKSFSLDQERGLFFCHRCNAKGSAWGFLKAQGYGVIQIESTLADYQTAGPIFTPATKTKTAPPGPIIATYDYHDEAGVLL